MIGPHAKRGPVGGLVPTPHPTADLTSSQPEDTPGTRSSSSSATTDPASWDDEDAVRDAALDELAALHDRRIAAYCALIQNPGDCDGPLDELLDAQAEEAAWFETYRERF